MVTIVAMLVLIQTLVLFAPQTSALTIGPGIYFDIGNENYSVNSGTMEFSQIVVNSTWIEFNNTYFNISSPNAISIKLIKLGSNLSNTTTGTTLISFIANTTAGTVYFNLSGLKNTYKYRVFRDSVLYASKTTDSKSNVNFSYVSWAIPHRFDIKVGGLRVVATTPTRLSYHTISLNGVPYGANGSKCGFIYGRILPTTNVSCPGTHNDGVAFTYNLTSLSSNTIYYYEAWAYNATDGYVYSALSHFTTSTVPTLSQVSLTTAEFIKGGIINADMFYVSIPSNMTLNTTINVPTSYTGKYFWFFTKTYTISSVEVYGITTSLQFIPITTTGNLDSLHLGVTDLSAYDAFIIIPNPGYFQTSAWWFGVLNSAQSVLLKGESL